MLTRKQLQFLWSAHAFNILRREGALHIAGWQRHDLAVVLLLHLSALQLVGVLAAAQYRVKGGWQSKFLWWCDAIRSFQRQRHAVPASPDKQLSLIGHDGKWQTSLRSQIRPVCKWSKWHRLRIIIRIFQNERMLNSVWGENVKPNPHSSISSQICVSAACKCFGCIISCFNESIFICASWYPALAEKKLVLLSPNPALHPYQALFTQDTIFTLLLHPPCICLRQRHAASGGMQCLVVLLLCTARGVESGSTFKLQSVTVPWHVE